MSKRGLNQFAREAIAHIAVYHAEGTFRARDLAHGYGYAVGNLVKRGYIVRTGNTIPRYFRATPDGLFYARRYASDEMEKFQGVSE